MSEITRREALAAAGRWRFAAAGAIDALDAQEAHAAAQQAAAARAATTLPKALSAHEFRRSNG